ncbi:MAG: SigB/SigF/SigG family RNA polymerase sigma factor [Mycobacterium sp.]|nr:SigB/SigF/SigG family RNA polymerase sigma factor [Mycobacterium sp.]
MTVAERDRSGIDAAEQDPDLSEVDDLFLRMAACSTDGERRRWRQRIITECLSLADHIAYRFVGRGEPSDDLIQVARMGLVKSVDRYEPAKGRFMAFAVPTIRGEVRRHFRDGTWSMRVPRKVQETQLRMRHAVEALSQQLNRSPTHPEVARELGIGNDEVAQSEAAHWAYRPLSLDAPRSGPEGFDPTSIGAMRGAEDPGYEYVEDSIVLREVVAELDPRRRAILGMRFFEGLTQREIALRLNISQVQVSRLLDDTLTRLRRRMSADASSPTAEVA